MKPIPKIFLIIIVSAFAAVLCSPVFAKSLPAPRDEVGDKTLSPFFFVKSEDEALDQLPLKSTSARVRIAGVMADVTVTQSYRNEGKTPLEAIYIFPASTRAAVYAMKMTIGERTIEAKIDRRDAARKIYETALQQGKSASLLEQQRPNVFQMNVGNIMPGDDIRVELKYTELVVPTDKVYEFVYPTVVGPRYSNQAAASAPASEHWVANPYLHQGEAAPYRFDIQVEVAAGLPIRDISCASHHVKTDYSGPNLVTVHLDPAEKHGANRDYVLRYRLDGDRIQSGILLHEGEKENFFLLMMQPPRRVTTAQIPGREYIFIVDVSGSMFGYPLEVSKKLLTDLIGGLRSTDRFNVLLFSGGSSLMSEQSVPATPENIRQALLLIDRQRGGGGTELLPAFSRALSLKKTAGYSRSIVIATDGYVTVEEEVFDLIRNNLGNANVFAFGIGTSVNRHIIEGMARVGLGEPFVITRPDEAAAKAEQLRKLIQAPVLTGVHLKFNGFQAYDIEPAQIPDVLSERPILVFGKYRGKAQGKIIVTGTSGEGAFRQTIDVAAAAKKTTPDHPSLSYLWARHRIVLLSDYEKLRSDDKRIDEVTRLGLAYNLLTAYTSFVAVDSEVRNHSGKTTTVTQPLPLPEGVSDYAVGGVSNQAAYQVSAPMAAKAAEDSAIAYKRCKKEPGLPIRTPYAGSDEKRQAETPVVTLQDVKVSEGLSRQAIEKMVMEKMNDLQQCLAGSTPGTTLTLKLIIKADGRVKSVEVLKHAGCSADSRRRLTRNISQWQFPRSENGKDVQATIVVQVNAD